MYASATVPHPTRLYNGAFAMHAKCSRALTYSHTSWNPICIASPRMEACSPLSRPCCLMIFYQQPEGLNILVQVSHFSLLVGMAFPVWLCIDPSNRCTHQLAAAFSGIAILGVADSAASVLGRRLGRHKILGTSKTWEGTLGGITCNTACWVLFIESIRKGAIDYRAAFEASIASCLLEASTTQLDNIFLPLHHLTWVLTCIATDFRPAETLVD